MPHCIDCGGSMTGDGITTPIACEFITVCAEPDAGPFYCGNQTEGGTSDINLRHERAQRISEDQFDRDAGRTCINCKNDLELNADWQCVRCGAHN